MFWARRTPFVLHVRHPVLSSVVQVAHEAWQATHSPFLAKKPMAQLQAPNARTALLLQVRHPLAREVWQVLQTPKHVIFWQSPLRSLSKPLLQVQTPFRIEALGLQRTQLFESPPLQVRQVLWQVKQSPVVVL